MNKTENAKPQPAGLWTEMDRADFDAAAPLTLFDLAAVDNSMHARPADKCGTPDLFTDWA